jgi:hypothetical protein
MNAYCRLELYFNSNEYHNIELMLSAGIIRTNIIYSKIFGKIIHKQKKITQTVFTTTLSKHEVCDSYLAEQKKSKA